MKLHFYLRYHTSWGQSLWLISGDDTCVDNLDNAIPLTYMNEEFWEAEIKIKGDKDLFYKYKYVLKNADGKIVPEFGNDRLIQTDQQGIKEIMLIDTWCYAGEFENVFYSAPFKNVLLKQNAVKSIPNTEKKVTHIFKIKAPLVNPNEAICISGNNDSLGNWDTEKSCLLIKEGDWWVTKQELSEEHFPLVYKYGIYNKKEKKFSKYENGDNRLLNADSSKKKLVILHDGFVRFPNNTWKGAGVAIPVFSLRSNKSFGVGQFVDLKLLVDWAKASGLKLIQILPVNDTTSTHGWPDSYPYSAISAFALHPLYINLDKVAGKKQTTFIRSLSAKLKELNALADLDFVEVMNFKIEALKKIYNIQGEELFDSEDYINFFKQNKHWLIPYASFCYLRDKYNTSNPEKWKTNSVYNKKEIEKLSSKNSPVFNEIAYHYFVQYHLHSQLKEAADYAHKRGIVLKGDIAIGVSRYGSDTWVHPELFNLDQQAGAPPDDFAIKGQNWGFPTYNWKKMQEDQFDWWRKRFEQMSNYSAFC